MATIKTNWQPICWVCTTGADEIRMSLCGDNWQCPSCAQVVPLETLPPMEEAECDRCSKVFPGSELQTVDPDGHGEAELCAKCLERMDQERAEEILIASCPDCGEIHPGPACHADDPEYRRV